jgi:uncharacterized protein (DUF1778 family)
MAATERLAFRPTQDDARMLRIVAGHLQHTRRTPFVTPSETLRACVRLAAEAVAKSTIYETKE